MVKQQWLLPAKFIAFLKLVSIQASLEAMLTTTVTASAPCGANELDGAIKKVCKFVNFLVESSTVRQNLLDLIKILCLSILAPMQRTVNRWFYKWYKVKWIVQLKPAVQELCEKYDLSEKIEGGRFEGKQITER